MSTVERPGTLAGWLRQQPDDVFARLLAARPDLLHPVPADVSVLASRAGGRVSVEIALDRLDQGALLVLEALALTPEPAGLAVIGEALGVDAKLVEPSLARLRDAALVWGDANEQRLASVVYDLVPYPAGLGPPVRLAFAELPPARLPALLDDLGELMGEPLRDPSTPVGAAESLAALAAVFEDADRLSRLIGLLPEKAREVVDLLAAGPPAGRVAAARRPVDAATADTPLRWLLAHGLLVAVDDYTVVLPREIALHVRGGKAFDDPAIQRPSLEAVAHSASDVNATAAGQAFAMVRLVESLLEAWGIDPPSVLRAGGVGVRDLRRTARDLDVDERVAALVIEVAHAAGLLAPDEVGESWLPTLGPAGYDAWLLKPTAQRWCALAGAWLTTTRVPALVGRRESTDPADPAFAGVASARGKQPAPNALGPDVDRALAPLVRRDVLRLLDEAGPGAAPRAAALLAVVRWSSPRRGGALRDDLVAWTLEEAESLGLTGRGALSSFGRALFAALAGPDGAGEADETAYPTARAAAALEPLLPTPLDHVLLQADLTAVAQGPLESDLSRELSLLADIESTGGATVYRFSPSSIRRALDAGRGAADIHALLAARSRTPVPQPLSYLIDDVARKHGRLRVGAAGAYLRCDDEAALTEVLADRRAESLRLHRIAPTVLVSPLPPERVTERLRALGFAPGAESPDGGLILRRPDARRAPSRLRVVRRRIDLAAPSKSVVAVAIRAIRSGDKAVAAARRHVAGISADAGLAGDALPRSSAGETLAVLRDAAASGRSLWIGYVNAQGQASNRIVEPQRLAGGYLTAFDHRHEELRTFAVHRITGVALLDGEDDEDGDLDEDGIDARAEIFEADDAI